MPTGTSDIRNSPAASVVTAPARPIRLTLALASGTSGCPMPSSKATRPSTAPRATGRVMGGTTTSWPPWASVTVMPVR